MNTQPHIPPGRRRLVLMSGAALLTLSLMCSVRAQGPEPSQPEAGAPAPMIEPPGTGDQPMTLKLTSTAFKEGEAIPKKHTADGADVSPPLEWTGAPAGTQAFALICDDPDAPVGTWVHWVIYGIPANTIMLPEAVPPKKELPNGARQGANDFKKIGYGGPAPPPGKPHRYYFKLYALDASIDIAPGATKRDVLKTIEGHVLGEAQLMGRYQR